MTEEELTDYNTKFYEFDLSKDIDLTCLTILPSVSKPQFYYLHNSKTKNRCEYFTLSSGAKVKKIVKVYFIRHNSLPEKLTPHLSFEIIHQNEIKSSTEIKAKVGLGSDEAKLLLHLIHYISQIHSVDTIPLVKYKFFYPDDEVILLAEKLRSAGKLKELEPFITGLTKNELNIVLGRKTSLEQFNCLLNDPTYWKMLLDQLDESDKKEEKCWQKFFEMNDWIFGFGLQLKFLEQVDREVPAQTERANRVIVDFLMQSDYTCTVEIKLPSTRLFNHSQNRSGSWRLSSELIDAVTQVLEQKVEWSNFAHDQESMYSQYGKKLRLKRTRDAKAYLVIGNKTKELEQSETDLEKETKADTLELFRQNLKGVDIITYDELFERSRLIIGETNDPIIPPILTPDLVSVEVRTFKNTNEIPW